MSRNENGDYNLPVGNPVLPNTVIESEWANSTLDDIKIALSDSLDRRGRGGMIAPLRLADGSIQLPALSFTSEFNMGFYKKGVGDVRFASRGKDIITIASLDQAIPLNMKFYGGDHTFKRGKTFFDGGDLTVKKGVYSLDGTGFAIDGDDAYVGLREQNRKVAIEGELEADKVKFDNKRTNRLTATTVQGAIDLLSVGSLKFAAISHSGGGILVAGAVNEILDGERYYLPPASSVDPNTLIGVMLPDSQAAFKPFIEVTEDADHPNDKISYRGGKDTDMRFFTPTFIWLTSDGIETWRY